MTAKWLQIYLDEAVHKKLCTRIYCTTSGAMEFRRGVLNALAGVTGQKPGNRYDHDSVLEITRALAEVKPSGETLMQMEAAVRCLLFDLWSGIPIFDKAIEDLLAGTWAGDVLCRMKEHYEAKERTRRAREEFEDPVNVRKRREEKKRLKQEQHQKRLELKKERDRLWRQNNGKAE